MSNYLDKQDDEDFGDIYSSMMKGKNTNSFQQNNQQINNVYPQQNFQQGYSQQQNLQQDFMGQQEKVNYNPQIDDYSKNNYEYNDINIQRNKVSFNKGILLIVGIVFAYIAYLIIGITSTSYKEVDGQKVAIIVDINTREARVDYDALKTYYISLNKLMDNTDLYEKQMEGGTIQYFTLSTKYSETLTSIDGYMTKISGLDVDDQYAALKEQLLIAYNNYAIYCQKMNAALLNDNYDDYVVALSWKEASLKQMENTRLNFIAFGEDYAKIFDDETFAKSRNEQTINIDDIKDNDDNNSFNTGNYGEIEETSTPTPTDTILGGGRLPAQDETIGKQPIENTGEDLNQGDGNISIDNPYGDSSTNDYETTTTLGNRN